MTIEPAAPSSVLLTGQLVPAEDTFPPSNFGAAENRKSLIYTLFIFGHVWWVRCNHQRFPRPNCLLQIMYWYFRIIQICAIYFLESRNICPKVWKKFWKTHNVLLVWRVKEFIWSIELCFCPRWIWKIVQLFGALWKWDDFCGVYSCGVWLGFPVEDACPASPLPSTPCCHFYCSGRCVHAFFVVNFHVCHLMIYQDA